MTALVCLQVRLHVSHDPVCSLQGVGFSVSVDVPAYQPGGDEEEDLYLLSNDIPPTDTASQETSDSEEDLNVHAGMLLPMFCLGVFRGLYV